MFSKLMGFSATSCTMYFCLVAPAATSATAAAASARAGCAVPKVYLVHVSAFVIAIVHWATELCGKVRQHHATWLVCTYVNGMQCADDVTSAVVALCCRLLNSWTAAFWECR